MVERHVVKTNNWHRERVQENPDLTAVPTFTSTSDANRAQGAATKLHKGEIEQRLQKDPK